MQKLGVFLLLCSDPIGVLDSGLGGISVLRELKKQLPQESYVYFADRDNAPYSYKSENEIIALTYRNVELLISHKCKAIVIACNTATAVGAEYVRKKYPKTAIIGLEPALKPAEQRFPNGKILVLATPITLKFEKFKDLRRRFDKGNVVCVAAPELVRYTELGQPCGAEAVRYLSKILAPYREVVFDACVLGCTHFPFSRRAISQALGYEPAYFDGAFGAARKLKNELIEHKLDTISSNSSYIYWCSKYNNDLQRKMFYNKE